MTDIRIFFKLTAIMAVVCISAVAITTVMLYLDEFREHQEILIQVAERQRKLIKGIILFNKEHAIRVHNGLQEANQNFYLSEAVKMVQRATEETGSMGDIEVVTAVKQGAYVFFVSYRGKKESKDPNVVAIGSKIAIPMQMALEGKSGVVRSLDYKGEEVLAAYTYVSEIKLGIVAKARIKSISDRFIRGAVFAAMPAFVLVLLGVWLFYKLTMPFIDMLRDEAERFRQMSIERTQALRDAKESEHRFKCFFDGAFEGIAITKDLKFVDSNQCFCDMYGYSNEEVVGMPIDSLVHPDDRERVLQRVNDGFTEPYEHRAIKKDGSVVCVEVRGQQTTYKGESVRITAIHDLTAHKDALAQIERLHERRRHATKMEAIGQFAAGIAHDFNNSLAPIIGNCDLLLLDIDRRSNNGDLAECRKKVVKIGTAAETAAMLVRRIQSFTRKESQSEELIALKIDDCIREAFEFLRSITPVSIEMELNIEENLGLVATTDVMVRQMLMNLVKNASHAMEDEEGAINIDVTNTQIRVERFGLTAGNYVRIDVEDNGCGMPEEVLERAIDPYFTTKDKESGTGLGLAVVNGILESHGGIIHLQSTEGIGTVASIYLPAIKGNGQEQSYCLIEEAPPKGDGQRIIFVDDEQGIVDMAQSLLSSLNYDVFGFNDSTEAFKEFCLNPGAYDVLMSDMTMPNMSGINLIQKVKEINPEIKVILSSGFGMNGRAKADLFSNLIDTYIQKPVTIRQYAEALADLFKINSD